MNSPTPLPSGAVTIAFTDIEGYSTLEGLYSAALQPLLDDHVHLLMEAAARHDGQMLRIVGDALFLVFEKPSQAVQFTVEAQHAINERPWSVTTPDGETIAIPLRVRMGMHVGEVRAVVQPNGQRDYFGTAVNKAARVMSAGHGGQILLSEAMRLLALEQLPPDITFLDLGPHRLKGVGEERLWQVLHEGLPREFEPVGAMRHDQHNLPLPLTPFLGRETELREWTAKLLEPGTRLMTITGFGGMGKTRLSMQIGEECFQEFEHGVWWVPLEHAKTGDEMIQRIAEQLVQTLKPQPTVREQLWDYHRDLECLLILDNLEQIEPPEDVAQVLLGLLNAGPRVKILATSRRGYFIAPECRVELDPFPPSLAETLFVERAKARKGDFTLNATNAPHIAEICRKLEGVPLAIEIAASRITLMTPQQMLPRLEAQLKSLVSQDPTLGARQKALRGAVEWSYNLLSEDAKTLFAQLAVFAGGFYFEAAIAVVCPEEDAGGAVLDEYAVEAALLELRNQSLLRAHTDANTQQERLSMLESVREYATDKLTDENVRRRHAEYYCHWASEQVSRLRTGDEASAIAAVEIEFDNLRAAFKWAQASDALLCARLSVAFHEPLDVRGHGEEALAALKKGWIALQSLTALDNKLPDVLRLRAALRHAQAGLLDDIGEQAPAMALARQSLQFYREAGDVAGEANTLNLLAVMSTGEDETAAQEFCRQALERWPSSHHVGRGKTLHNLGQIAQHQGDIAGARGFYEAALVERRLADDTNGLSKTLGNLGTLAQREGDLPEARRYYAESLQIWRQLRHRCNTAIALNNLGDVALLEEDIMKAIVLLMHAERIFLDLKSPYAAEPTRLLGEIKEKIGEDEYTHLRADAEGKAWEDVV